MITTSLKIVLASCCFASIGYKAAAQLYPEAVLSQWYVVKAKEENRKSRVLTTFCDKAVWPALDSGNSSNTGHTNHFAPFSIGRKDMEIEIALANGSPVKSCTISPQKFRRQARLQDGKAYINLNSAPAQWMVIVNDNKAQPLFLFVNLSTTTSDKTKDKALTVGSGYHDWETNTPSLDKFSGIHLAEGAVVKGNINVPQQANFAISGSGVWIAPEGKQAINADTGKGNLTISGITVVGGMPFAISSGLPAKMDNLKIINPLPSGGGMELYAQSSVYKSFLKTGGTGLHIKGGNLEIRESLAFMPKNNPLFQIASQMPTTGNIEIQYTSLLSHLADSTLPASNNSSVLSVIGSATHPVYSSIYLNQLDSEQGVNRLLAVSAERGGETATITLLRMSNVQLPAVYQKNYLLAGEGSRLKVRLEAVKVNNRIVLHDDFLRKGAVSLGIQ